MQRNENVVKMYFEGPNNILTTFHMYKCGILVYIPSDAT